METRDKVRNYIIENFLFGNTDVLADDNISLTVIVGERSDRVQKL